MGVDTWRSGRMVWVAAALAFLARFPSLLWPLRPDEAGFLLVAQAWQPEVDSVFGRYFVDRPPVVIALMRAVDAVGGAYAHRLVAAVGCALLVLAAAAAAREVAVRAGVLDPHAVRRVTGWTAVAAAALVSNADIDPAGAKGELFGIPLVMGSCWLALRAARRGSGRDAFLAGLLAMLAVGMKQSMAGGLVFGATLLVGSLVAQRLDVRARLRCTASALAGAVVPVVGVVAWAVVAGVRLDELWYTVVTFRSEASEVLAAQDSPAALGRGVDVLLVFVGTGMVLVLVLFALRLRGLLRRDPVVVVAITATLVADLLGVALSGSFWVPYLFVPIPGLALAVAALAAHDQVDRVPRWATPATVGVLVVSSVVALLLWTGSWVRGRVPVEVRTGEAIAAAGRPGDRVLVYGGRADIQWASGAPSPYPYLWSLPMRTRDPDLQQLEEVLTGPNPPTWFVEAAHIDAWADDGTRPVERSLIRKYEFVGTACDRYRVYHLNTVDPIRLDVDCTTPFRTIRGH
ncbi:hypothetical protein [Nocardioides sp. zg-1228]|uniref:hypothetical protein n=1 Tax=Nocardioides sp. zg-1228 TaxID=2763008 RepID=UPI001642C074|nr:hypothetical protein [Nocardioides sp. zg-1228]MBC2934784.1 hypothetical protein [Nocardioides sp. zg-1228]QSF58425.1 hypothetical protein JX575_04245 [Nocardioides sp. zg-1228]